jgi:hypothetical protein
MLEGPLPPAKYLADENFPGSAVKALRNLGLDVAWVLEDQAGAGDEVVLQRAILRVVPY